MKLPDKDRIVNGEHRYSEDALYRHKFPWPKRNVRVTALDVPQILRRLLPEWTKEQHLRESESARAIARNLEGAHADCVADAARLYGTDGPQISGVVREHWPEPIKNTLRYLAHRASFETQRSQAHWIAAGRRNETWKRLSA